MSPQTPVVWPDDHRKGTLKTAVAKVALFSQGDSVKTVDFIVSGVVCITSRVDGRELLSGIRGPGWPLGAIPAVRRTRHIATATALTDCTFRSWNVADFDHLRRESAPFGIWLQEMLTREAFDQFRRTQTWALCDGTERLDELLVELSALAGHETVDGSIKLVVPIQMGWLGDMAMVRRETASRHFSRRTAGGSLRKENGWIIVPNGSDLVARIRESANRLARR